jgi:hypothetical protein
MNKILNFFKSVSPFVLILICVCIGIVAKLIEKHFADIAMGLQLITFFLFLYTLGRFFGSKSKKK